MVNVTFEMCSNQHDSTANPAVLITLNITLPQNGQCSKQHCSWSWSTSRAVNCFQDKHYLKNTQQCKFIKCCGGLSSPLFLKDTLMPSKQHYKCIFPCLLNNNITTLVTKSELYEYKRQSKLNVTYCTIHTRTGMICFSPDLML